MKIRVPLLASAITGVLCFSTPGAFARTASCPCSPCKCSPCTCGGSKSSGGGGGKHHGDHHGGHHDHGGGTSFGIGGTIDLNQLGNGLGRLLQKPTEPKSTPVPKGTPPIARTEEKPKPKRKEHQPTTNSFDEIKLTGSEAKGENNPPNTFNVSNDETPPPEPEQPKLPPTEVLTPKAPADPMGDLKKAHDDYHKACSDWLKKQPNWNSIVHDWTNSPNTEEGNKKSSKAYKKVLQLMDQFNGGDGKQLVDDWEKAFDNQLKSGGTVDDNSLIPPPSDEIEKKKYAVLKAQNELNRIKKTYDENRDRAANNDDEANKAREKLNGFNPKDVGYKAAVDEFDKKKSEAGAKWAGTEEGKKEIQKVHDAEKELDKAKEAWKPFEKYVEK